MQTNEKLYKHIDNSDKKIFSGFIKGINKSVSVVKIAEDKNERDIWMRYNPVTEKVFGRRYYRTDNGSDLLELVPLRLSERLNKIRTEGLGGKGSKEISRNMAAENPEPTRRSESSQSIERSYPPTIRSENLVRVVDMSSLEKYNPVRFGILKTVFNNALKMCTEANNIVKSLNDSSLIEELKNTFGELNFSVETINAFRVNIEKLQGEFNHYNDYFHDFFRVISIKNLGEAFSTKVNPPLASNNLDNGVILISDTFFYMGGGITELCIIHEMTHNKTIMAGDYFYNLSGDDLLVPNKSINDLIPLHLLKTKIPDKLRHINYLLLQHFENEELALKTIKPGPHLVSLVFGKEDALNHQPEEALLKILKDKDLLTKNLPFNADSLTQLVLHLLIKNSSVIDNEVIIKNVDIVETINLLDDENWLAPLRYIKENGELASSSEESLYSSEESLYSINGFVE